MADFSLRGRLTAINKQRGVTTILIVLMVGLGVSVAVLGAAYTLRSTQQQQLTTHAVTAAQAAAWRGVEIIRTFLTTLDAGDLDSLEGKPITVADKATSGSLGITATVTGVQEISSGTHYRITAQVTGRAGEGDALTTSTVEVVYEIAPGGSLPSPAPSVCASLPTSPLILNGDVDYSGGGLSVTNTGGDYNNVAISGDLTIGSGSTAKISGCVKGDATLSGGGITSNGHLYSEGTISISNMSEPSGTTLWAKSINITQHGGSYTTIRAGGYSTTVVANGSTVGTAVVGGVLLGTTVPDPVALPWTQGTVMPLNTGNVVIVLGDGTEYLLDMSTVSIDADTGEVSNTSAAERLAGTGDSELPDSFHFRSTAIHGGDIGIMQHTVGTLWGHAITASGHGGTYTNLWSNGDLKLTASGTITNLTGGGWMWVSGANGDIYNEGQPWESASYSNFPTINGMGSIAGNLYYSSTQREMPDKYLSQAVANLTVRQTGTTPGLPGVPYCDTRLDAINADNYKASANYVFEFVNNVPQLTIQNVRRANGQSIDGVYKLRNPDSTEQALLTALFICDYSIQNNPGCLQNGANWSLTGVTRIPTGVFWFDRNLTISGTEVDLLATLVSKGDITLTQSGHRDLYAPNFSTPTLVCDGNFYPSNLCTRETGAWAFTTWTDDTGGIHTGQPIANSALITEAGLTALGWTIHGNVSLGEQFASGANTTTIYGSMSVGANQPSTTTVSQGGLAIVVPTISDNLYLPVCSPSTGSGTPGSGSGSGSPQATVLWARYL